MPYTPVLATLGYVLSPDGRQALMIHRDRNPADYHYGKFNGLGGKLEPGEDIVACMRREIREEAGIECTRMALRGTVSWPGFGKHGQDWFGFIFRIDSFKGTPHNVNAEGSVCWIDREAIMNLPLWEGDRHFLPLVFDDSVSQFHGVMPYRDGRPVDWAVSHL